MNSYKHTQVGYLILVVVLTTLVFFVWISSVALAESLFLQSLQWVRCSPRHSVIRCEIGHELMYGLTQVDTKNSGRCIPWVEMVLKE